MYFKEKFEKDLLFIDELTGIFNRRFFERILPNIFKKCESSVFIIIDVDNFKNLNDRYGHRNGDLFLKKIGEILKKFFYNENEFPLRYGGDEFLIAIFDVEREKGIEKLKEIFNVLSNIKLIVNGEEIKASISAGISFYPEDADKFEELFKRADESLYYIKRKGKNNFAIYKEISYKLKKEKILKRKFTPKDFIGFEEERKIIEEGINLKKGLFIIEGESGTGKTRLIRYISDKIKEKEIIPINSFTLKTDKFLPFIPFLRGINFWLDKEKIEILREKGFEKYFKYFPIAGGEKKFSFELEECFEFLEKFLQIFEICFLIDDALNIDKYSIDFIDMFKNKKLFFLSVPNIKHLDSSIIEKGIILKLSNLSYNLLKIYLKEILPEFIYPEEFLRWLSNNSKNNPFFIEEIIMYLIEKEYIKIGDGIFKLENFDDLISRKIDFVEITKERLEKLEDEEKNLLYNLSIGEKYFDVNTASNYTGINYGKIIDILEKLIEKGFISKISEEIYFFKNTLIKDIIYKSMDEKVKKNLHLKMAKIFEESEFLPGFLKETEISKHYKFAGEIEKAKEAIDRINYFLLKLKEIPDLKRLLKIIRRGKVKREIEFLPLKMEIFHDVDLFLKRFYGCIEAIKIYPSGSSIIIDRIKELYEILKNILSIQKNVIIGIHSEKLIVNENEIQETKVYIKKLKDLFDEMKIESIILKEDIEFESLKEFFNLIKEGKELVLKGKSIEDEIENRNLKGIYANERVYITVGGEYGELLDIDKLDFEFKEIYKEKEIEEDVEVKVKKFINQKEKLKEIIDEELRNIVSKKLEEKKERIEKLENLYHIFPEEVKDYFSEKIFKFYFKSEKEIKEYLKQRIFIYLERIIEKKFEEIKDYLEEEREIIFDNFEKFIQIEKLKDFIFDFSLKNFNEILKILKKEDFENNLIKEILKNKLRETKGRILKDIEKKEILFNFLKIVKEEKIKVEPKIILDLFLKNINREISLEAFKILEEEIEFLNKYVEEIIREKREGEIDRILLFIKDSPKEEFMKFIMEIIRKRNKIEREFPLFLQIRALEIIKKMDIGPYIKQLFEIAKREKFFSLKKNKPETLRLEIIKILANYLKEKGNLNYLKVFEKDKNTSIRFFVGKTIYGK